MSLDMGPTVPLVVYAVTAKYMLYLTRRSLQFGENQIRRILRH